MRKITRGIVIVLLTLAMVALMALIVALSDDSADAAPAPAPAPGTGPAPDTGAPAPPLVLAPATLDKDGVLRFTLANGLRALVRPVENVDSVGVVLLFNFGERSDPEGKSGMGHLMEHLYRTAAAGDAPSRTYEELSARYTEGFGAQTGEVYTTFAAIVPAQGFDAELRDVAARLRGPSIEQSDLDREKPRMAAELANMYGAMPLLALRNEARERALPSLPGARRGGSLDQIQALTLEDLCARLRFYRPCNATLSIAGALDAAQAREMITKALGDIPPGEPAPPIRPRGERAGGSVTPLPLLPEGTEPIALNAYAVPSPAGDQFLSIAMIVGRLQMALYRPGVQTMLPPVFHPALDDPHILFVNQPMLPGETPEAAAARLDALVASVCEAPVTPEERAMFRMGLGGFLGLTPIPDEAAGGNLYGVAFSIGRREQLGYKPDALNTALDALSAEDLKAAQREWLSPEKRVSVALVRPSKPAAP